MHTRKVVGWSMRETLRASITLEALDMAIRRQRPAPGLIQHSDRGIQYTADEYRQALAAAKTTPSMSRKGNCLDNSPMESFFHTLKVERVHHRVYPTQGRSATGSVRLHRGLLQFTPPTFRDRIPFTGRHGAHGGLTPSTFPGQDQIYGETPDCVVVQPVRSEPVSAIRPFTGNLQGKPPCFTLFPSLRLIKSQ